jgi:hypothetical protein
MKSNIIHNIITAIILLVAIFNPARAPGASYAVGLSPNYIEPQRTEVFRDVLAFILETADPGDTITICDALNQKLVASFAIPEGRIFQSNARARAQRLAAPLAAFKQFIGADRSFPPVLRNAVALPQFLDFAATQLRRPGESLRVVVLASPLYVDVSGNDAFTMLSAFPSDGTLAATPEQSPFGCALKKTILSGVTVNLAYLNTPFLNDYHQQQTCRFLVLYCQQTSGCLSSWCADPILAFRRAKENIQQPCVEAKLDLTDTKIEMRQVLRRSVVASRAITNHVARVSAVTDVPNVTTISVNTSDSSRQTDTAARPASTPTDNTSRNITPSRGNGQIESERPTTPFEPAKLAEAFPVKPAAKSFGVGIAWSAAVDLDLWLQPFPGAAELSFHSTNSPQGRYLQDWRSGNLGLDYEYVLLNPDEAVDLARLGCWVNYYDGRVAPVRGVVVVHYEGRAYHGEFTLTAPSGNKAGDLNNRQKSRCWVQLDLAAIVRAGRSVQAANSIR